MKKVAVIGAGAAGLVTARHLASKPDLYRCVVYEATSHVGGTWKYNEHVTKHDKTSPTHGAMYQNLITNLPKEIMAFPDLAFDQSLRSFMPHQEVQNYLERYANTFDLLKCIKLEHRVERISLTNEDSSSHWRITTKVRGEQESTDDFDAVFICNGHYSIPYIPAIEATSSFRGTIEHSRHYRKPDRYRDKTVVLLGARPSGQDISIDIAKVAKRVIVSHWGHLSTPLPDNVHQRQPIVKFTETGVIFQDGVVEDEVDDVILCTGYEYAVPFLDQSCDISVNDGRIYPLYKHIVNVQHPTMFFIGVCGVVCPFPNFDAQVRYALAWLDDSFKKPDRAAMLAWIEKDYQYKVNELGWKHKHAHILSDLQWAYVEDLASEAGIRGIPPVIQRIYDHVWEDRHTNVMTYRDVEFKLVDEITEY